MGGFDHPQPFSRVGAPALIIFDCDGVLVDSEPIAMRVLLNAIAAEGTAIDPASAYRDFLGRSLASVSATLRDSHGASLAGTALESMRRELYALYRKELRPMPGIVEALGRIKTPVCVASSSNPERIRLSLELTGLSGFFGEHVFSATMVANGKPAPDLFLHAARQMGARPETCLVIEDSPAGIRAAQDAGMPVFAFVGGSHIGPGAVRPLIEALAPDLVFDDMRKLPDLVSSPQGGKTAS